MLNYNLQTQIVQFVKLKQMMFIKIFMKTKICLILVTIHKIKVFYPVNEKVISSMKDEFKGKIISEFVVLRSKMYSLIAVAKKL